MHALQFVPALKNHVLRGAPTAAQLQAVGGLKTRQRALKHAPSHFLWKIKRMKQNWTPPRFLNRRPRATFLLSFAVSWRRCKQFWMPHTAALWWPSKLQVSNFRNNSQAPARNLEHHSISTRSLETKYADNPQNQLTKKKQQRSHWKRLPAQEKVPVLLKLEEDITTLTPSSQKGAIFPPHLVSDRYRWGSGIVAGLLLTSSPCTSCIRENQTPTNPWIL